MKEIVPEASQSIVRNEAESVRELFRKHVAPTYGRFELVFSRGEGSYLWDVHGKRYLDMGGGIAVTALGHGNAELADAVAEQARALVHVSNLYYTDPQGRLAQRLVQLLGAGKVFLCNSGAEANEALYKLARRFGHEQGRFEILTVENSFHGRTLGGIAATGQEKVKQGFGPATPGFRQVAFNDLPAIERALSPATCAVLVECVQGESGVRPVSPEYLLGLRRLCDEKRLLLLVDEVQAGMFRTGRFASYQTMLEGTDGGGSFIPDGVSLAKSLGGGFPIGAVWFRDRVADLLGAGSHGTTFGGTPVACQAALRVLQIIERDGLGENARRMGELLKNELEQLRESFPAVVTGVRGIGLMAGLEFASQVPSLSEAGKSVAVQMVQRLHGRGLITIPAGSNVIRFLPALNIGPGHVREAAAILREVFGEL